MLLCFIGFYLDVYRLVFLRTPHRLDFSVGPGEPCWMSIFTFDAIFDSDDCFRFVCSSIQKPYQRRGNILLLLFFAISTTEWHFTNCCWLRMFYLVKAGTMSNVKLWTDNEYSMNPEPILPNSTQSKWQYNRKKKTSLLNKEKSFGIKWICPRHFQSASNASFVIVLDHINSATSELSLKQKYFVLFGEIEKYLRCLPYSVNFIHSNIYKHYTYTFFFS